MGFCYRSSNMRWGVLGGGELCGVWWQINMGEEKECCFPLSPATPAPPYPAKISRTN